MIIFLFFLASALEGPGDTSLKACDLRREVGDGVIGTAIGSKETGNRVVSRVTGFKRVSVSDTQCIRRVRRHHRTHAAKAHFTVSLRLNGQNHTAVKERAGSCELTVIGIETVFQVTADSPIVVDLFTDVETETGAAIGHLEAIAVTGDVA